MPCVGLVAPCVTHDVVPERLTSSPPTCFPEGGSPNARPQSFIRAQSPRPRHAGRSASDNFILSNPPLAPRKVRSHNKMPASEVGVAERTLNFTAGGVVAGSLIGLASAAYSKPAVGEATLAYVGKTTGGHAAMFAAMAGIFAATDTFLDQSRGHSALNSVAAGCAAGAVVGARQGDPTRAAFGCALFGTVQALGEPPEMSSRPHAFSLTLPRCSCVPSQAP